GLVVRRVVIPPLFREAIGLPRLPGVAVTIRAVLALDERRIDRPADLRHPPRQEHRGDRPEDDPRPDLDDAAPLAPLGHRRVAQARRRGPVRGPGPARLAGTGR